MADDRLAVAAIGLPGPQYEQQNEAAFRREVQDIMHQVNAALSRSAAAGVAAHASNHLSGGSDPLTRVPLFVKLTSGSYAGTTLTSAGSITIAETGYYHVKVHLRQYTSATTDWQIRLRFTSGASGYFIDVGAVAAGTGGAPTTEGAARIMAGSNAARYNIIEGYMDILTTGDFHVDLAESSGTGTYTLYDGSFMELTWIAAT